MIRYQVTADASGAALAGQRGDVVVVIDVIDMSTTAEALIDGGIDGLWGAAPAECKAPVSVNPERIGMLAGKEALSKETEVVVVAEPRVGSEDERHRLCQPVLHGVTKAGAKIAAIIPNLGAETVKITEVQGKVAILVTDTGGTAFDAAYQAGAAAVLTATVARTQKKRGQQPALDGVLRAKQLAMERQASITFVAASANSLEDVLAAEYLGKLLLCD